MPPLDGLLIQLLDHDGAPFHSYERAKVQFYCTSVDTHIPGIKGIRMPLCFEHGRRIRHKLRLPLIEQCINDALFPRYLSLSAGINAQSEDLQRFKCLRQQRIQSIDA